MQHVRNVGASPEDLNTDGARVPLAAIQNVSRTPGTASATDTNFGKPGSLVADSSATNLISSTKRRPTAEPAPLTPSTHSLSRDCGTPQWRAFTRTKDIANPAAAYSGSTARHNKASPDNIAATFSSRNTPGFNATTNRAVAVANASASAAFAAFDAFVVARECGWHGGDS